jgi:hypothetical protein
MRSLKANLSCLLRFEFLKACASLLFSDIKKPLVTLPSGYPGANMCWWVLKTKKYDKPKRLLGAFACHTVL